MEQGGPYKGSRSYRVASKRRGDQRNKKRKRLYISDSHAFMQHVADYINRVKADGGVVDTASIQCVSNVIFNLSY